MCRVDNRLNKGDPCTRPVDMPDIEPLILVQTLLELVWSVALGQDTLPSLIKPAGEVMTEHSSFWYRGHEQCAKQ